MNQLQAIRLPAATKVRSFFPPVTSTFGSPNQHVEGSSRWSTSRRGLSLLEVMLALAILGVSLAAIGELMRIGSRNAEMARDLTTAQILCETKMAEMVTGLIPPMTTTAAPILDVGSGNDWLFSVEAQPIGQEGLLAVRVVVQQNPDFASRPASFALVRWIIDPNFQAMSGSSDPAATGSTTSS